MIIVLIFILYAIIVWTHPWFDFYDDYRGIKHIMLWYTNYKGIRKYIQIK